jgi:hypothetical protein
VAEAHERGMPVLSAEVWQRDSNREDYTLAITDATTGITLEIPLPEQYNSLPHILNRLA